MLNDDLDNPIQSQNAYEGILLENFIAYILFIVKIGKILYLIYFMIQKVIIKMLIFYSKKIQ